MFATKSLICEPDAVEYLYFRDPYTIPGSSSSSAAEHTISEMSDCHENEDRAGSENGRLKKKSWFGGFRGV